MTVEAVTDAEVGDVAEDAGESDAAILADVFPGQFSADEEAPAAPAKGKASGKAGKQATTAATGKAAAAKPQPGAPSGKAARAGEEDAAEAAGTSAEDGAGDDAGQPSRNEQLSAVDDDALFDEKALATATGIKAARQALVDARQAAREVKRETHSVFLRTQRREESSKVRAADLNRREAVFSAQVNRVSADLDMMSRGNADEALQALGRLRGVSGAEAYEQLTQTMIANGKKPAVQRDPELVALIQQQQQQIAQLTAVHAQQTEAQAREAWRSTITQAVQSAEYPALNEAFRDHGRDLIDRMNEIKLDYWKEHRTQLDDGALLRHFETKLKGYRSTRNVVQAEAVEATPPAARPRPGDRRVPRSLPGQGISPNRASASAGSRELTDEERYQELVNEPDILRKLGLG